MRLKNLFGLLAYFSLAAGTCLANEEANLEARAVKQSIQTFQRCSTQYCPTTVKNVPKSTKYVHKKTTTSITVKKYQKTRYVVNPAYTRTIVTTVQPTTTSIHSTVYTTVTIRSTYTFLIEKVSTVTEYTSAAGVTTFTSRPPTSTVPAPRGHVDVLQDPVNRGRFPYYAPQYDNIKKREALPEPVPAKPPSYPKAISCTKTYKTHYTITSTKTIASTTKTVAASTTTKTRYRGSEVTIHKTPRWARTRATTVTKSTTVGSTTRYTWTTTLGRYSSTVTVRAPAETYYAACGFNNQAPPPGTSFHTDGWTAGYGASNAPFTTRDFPTNGTAYDCCVACLNEPEQNGTVCVGSFWIWRRFWGAPPCFEDPEPWGPWCEEPKDAAQCTLYKFRKDQCPAHKRGFGAESGYDTPRVVSNGPACAIWNFEGANFGLWS